MSNRREAIKQWQIDATAAAAVFIIFLFRLAEVVPALHSEGLDALGWFALFIALAITAMKGRSRANAH